MKNLKEPRPEERVKTAEDMKRVLRENRNVVFKFYSPTCRPCKDYDEMLSRYQVEDDMEVMVFPVNVHDAPELVKTFNITSVPFSLILNSEGDVRDSMLGFPAKKAFTEFLTKNCSF